MSLSGGQKQRVAIGSALAANKSIILFDEPTSGLDYKHMEEVAENFKRLSDQGKTCLLLHTIQKLLTKCCNYLCSLRMVKYAGKTGGARRASKN